MSSTIQSPVGNVSTYTCHDPQGKTIEVLLIPISRDELGVENSFPPPSLMDSNLSNWARGGYFFIDNDAIAQLPRNAEDLPLDQNASEVTDITHREGVIEAYYPVDREQAVRIAWDYHQDEWSAEYEDCRLREGSLDPESVAGTIVWSVDSEKYTT